MKTTLSLMAAILVIGSAQARTEIPESLESICKEIEVLVAKDQLDASLTCDFKSMTETEARAVTQGEICQVYAQKELGLPMMPQGTKPVSAKVVNLNDKRVQITVDHGVIKNVSLSQMSWWYRNLANPRILKTKLSDCLPYTILDKDHIDVGSRNTNAHGEIVPGSKVTFNEMTKFNGQAYHLNEEINVADIKSSYLRYEKRKIKGISLGLTLGVTERYFQAEGNGVRVISILTAGIDGAKHPQLSKLNKILIGKLFPHPNQQAWINHSSQEIANLTTFIPWILSKQ